MPDEHRIIIRTALLEKEDMLALVGVTTNERNGAICSFDGRVFPPVTWSKCDTPALARAKFRGALRTSQQNGWRVFYDGVPLRG